MCMEDIRIGRKMQINEQLIQPAVTFAQCLPAAPNRVALILCCDNGVILYYSTLPSGSAFRGISIAAQQAPIRLTIQEHGQLVTRAWYVRSFSTADQISIFETILLEQ